MFLSLSPWNKKNRSSIFRKRKKSCVIKFFTKAVFCHIASMLSCDCFLVEKWILTYFVQQVIFVVTWKKISFVESVKKAHVPFSYVSQNEISDLIPLTVYHGPSSVRPEPVISTMRFHPALLTLKISKTMRSWDMEGWYNWDVFGSRRPLLIPGWKPTWTPGIKLCPVCNAVIGACWKLIPSRKVLCLSPFHKVICLLKNCPLGEDETLCSLNDKECAKTCHRLALSIHCNTLKKQLQFKVVNDMISVEMTNYFHIPANALFFVVIWWEVLRRGISI